MKMPNGNCMKKQKLELTWIGKEKRLQLEVQLQQQVEEQTLFTTEWELK